VQFDRGFGLAKRAPIGHVRKQTTNRWSLRPRPRLRTFGRPLIRCRSFAQARPTALRGRLKCADFATCWHKPESIKVLYCFGLSLEVCRVGTHFGIDAVRARVPSQLSKYHHPKRLFVGQFAGPPYRFTIQPKLVHGNYSIS